MRLDGTLKPFPWWGLRTEEPGTGTTPPTALTAAVTIGAITVIVFAAALCLATAILHLGELRHFVHFAGARSMLVIAQLFRLQPTFRRRVSDQRLSLNASLTGQAAHPQEWVILSSPGEGSLLILESGCAPL